MTAAADFEYLRLLAADDYDSVVELTRDLVRISSRGGIDPYDPVLAHMASWLEAHGLSCRRLSGPSGSIVALTCEVLGVRPGPRYVLDACLDTAPFGDELAWTYPPTSGEIVDGWMHGRGCADSKVGAAIFAHIAARLRGASDDLPGSVVLLFDVDEHTGAFGGAKAFFEDCDLHGHVDGVMIGYPGLEHVVVGGRGVLRARVRVHGIAGHSGGSKTSPGAIAKAATLITALTDAELPGPAGPQFPLPARLTVTAIGGGEGYSSVPDVCTFNVDIRLTPAFGGHDAFELLRSYAEAVDEQWPTTPPTQIELTTRWPQFALGGDSALRSALLSATAAAGLRTAAKIAGPSNIGNYLAGLGIAATAGFGVAYEGLHGTDERIQLNSIPTVQAVYHRSLLTLLQPA